MKTVIGHLKVRLRGDPMSLGSQYTDDLMLRREKRRRGREVGLALVAMSFLFQLLKHKR